MTTYKVHDELGGYDCTLAPDHIHAGSSWPNHQLVSVPSETVGHWYVLVPKTALTEVKPSLPPEPTELGWYLATIGDSEVPFERQTDGWWNATYRDFKESWARLHEDYPGITMVRLIPAPELVTLPWTGASIYESVLRVRLGCSASNDDPIHVRVGADVGSLSSAIAREMAAALNTAAAEADRRSAALLTDTTVLGAS